MFYFQRWFMIGFTLVVGAGPLLAASREERTYAASVAKFNDQFYDRAAEGFAQFLQSYRKSTNAPSATLLLAQSEFYLGRYANVIARLTDTNNLAKAKVAGMDDRYLYWRAEAEFASGHFQVAAQTFVSLSEKYPQSPLALTSVVEAAAAYEKLQQWPQVDDLLEATNGVFQRAAQLDPANSTVADGRLLQSESKFAQGDFSAVLRLLNALTPATLTPVQDWKRAHQLYRANLRLDDLDAALAATTNLLTIARVGHGDGWATNLAESVACHAAILEQQGRLADAAAAWRENLSNNVPVEQQQRAILKIAALAAAQKNLPAAVTSLSDFVRQFASSPAADLALLTLGELQLKDFLGQPTATNLLAAAQDSFDQLTGKEPSGPLAGKAYLDSGWCHWLAGQYADSLTDFQMAARLLPISQDLALARFKMGDAEFALDDFAGAQTNYQSVLTDFTAFSEVNAALDGRALYQILRAQLARHETRDVDETMRQLLGKFSTNAPVENSLLLAGQGFSDYGSPEKARAVFRDFEAQHTNSPLLPQVAFAVGRTYEREQNWPAAVTNYQTWLGDYATNELRPQVEYARNWAVWQTGDEAGAFLLFTNFVSHFASNSLAPLAHWWIADHFFRLGDTNYQEAERNYEYIFQEPPTNELAYPAQLMAGRAAMGRSGYKDARDYFVALINDTNTPADLAVQARFGFCEALLKMNASDTNNVGLQTVTNILSQLCSMSATNVAGALAWSEMGDCNRQLDALDAATNAYAQALSSPMATPELRCRAQVGLGLVLKKKAEGLPDDDRKALLNQALDHFLAVVYLKADEFWVKKAGLEALPLVNELENDDAKQKFFNRLEVLLPQLKETLEKKRAALSKN